MKPVAHCSFQHILTLFALLSGVYKPSRFYKQVCKHRAVSFTRRNAPATLDVRIIFTMANSTALPSLLLCGMFFFERTVTTAMANCKLLDFFFFSLHFGDAFDQEQRHSLLCIGLTRVAIL